MAVVEAKIMCRASHKVDEPAESAPGEIPILRAESCRPPEFVEVAPNQLIWSALIPDVATPNPEFVIFTRSVIGVTFATI